MSSVTATLSSTPSSFHVEGYEKIDFSLVYTPSEIGRAHV